MYDLLSYPNRAGAKAPGTSFDAARQADGHAPILRQRIIEKLEEVAPFGLTADELAAAIGESILSARPRVSELVGQGRVKKSNLRRKNTSGMSATVWVLA